MKRPPIYSNRYYFNAFGSFALFMVTDVLLGLFLKHLMSLWVLLPTFLYILAFTIFWMRYLEWMQGHRERIWSAYDFDSPWVVHKHHPEALRREMPIPRDIENIK